MAKLEVPQGATSKLIHIFVQDSSQTVIKGLTGLAYNSSGLTCYYLIEGASASVAVTLATATLGTWATGGFVVVDGTNMPGLYEFSIPNLALASGKSVKFYFQGATNMSPVIAEIELTQTNNQDGVHFGLTALPNAAAAASGGIPTFGTGAGQLNLDGSGNVFLNANESIIVRSGTAQAGGASTITLDSGASGTNSFYNQMVVKIVSGTGAGQAAVISSYNGTSKVATISGTWITNPSSSSVFVVCFIPLGRAWDEVLTAATHNVVNSAGRDLRNAAPTASDVIHSGTAQAGSANTITLDSGASATNNAYQYDILSITGGTGAGQSKWIASYVGSTKVATVNSNWVTNPDSTSTFEITPTNVSQTISFASGLLDANGNLNVNIADIGGAASVGAAGYMAADLTEVVPYTNTANTLGDCLNAARVQGFGAWSIVGTTLTLKNADGSTAHTFTLNSSSAPTART